KSYKRERGSPKTWLMAIVHHRSIDRLRAHAAGTQTLPIDEVPENFPEVPGVWQQVWSDMRADTVRNALAKLPLEQKKSIEIAHFSGYSQSEVANLMGGGVGTVRG